MRDTITHAQLLAEGCTAELYLNGIPTSRIHPDRLPNESVDVESLIIPGRNRLELLVEPGSHPSVARTEARHLDLGPEVVAVGRLMRYRDGEITDDRGDKLVEVRFERDPDQRGGRTVPISYSAEVDLGPANGRWAWQDAPVLTLDEALVAEACTVLDQVREAWASRSPSALWALSGRHVADGVRAYPHLGEDGLRGLLAEMLAQYENTPEFVFPRVPEEHDFRLVAGGRLLECVDRDWYPSVRFKSPATGNAVPFAVFLARLDGQLVVAR
jgi:hypothetical protein